MIHPPPNELYIAFSAVGFVFCAIPFYWHVKARNASTCMYLVWTGLGCLMQCVNAILWNRNIVDRVPVYSDISTHIQVALNVAIPASSLCINRRLYRIATIRTAGVTDDEKRRHLIYDLLIGVGIPVLQVFAEYVVSGNRYNIFEDFGPILSIWNTPLAYVLFFSWPIAIGVVSFFYCITTIWAFYKHRRAHLKLSFNAKRSQYLRLMTISLIEILGTVPLGTYYIISNAKTGVIPWQGWAAMRRNNAVVVQVPSSTWKNDPVLSRDLEINRWSLVACAFIFFALFGFAGEAREHYYRLYKWCTGKSSPTPPEALFAATPVSYTGKNGKLKKPFMVQMVQMDRHKSTTSAEGTSTLVSFDSTTKQDFLTIVSDGESVANEPGMEHRSQPAPLTDLLRADP